VKPAKLALGEHDEDLMVMMDFAILKRQLARVRETTNHLQNFQDPPERTDSGQHVEG
jgi:hypothetical protein